MDSEECAADGGPGSERLQQPAGHLRRPLGLTGKQLVLLTCSVAMVSGSAEDPPADVSQRLKRRVLKNKLHARPQQMGTGLHLPHGRFCNGSSLAEKTATSKVTPALWEASFLLAGSCIHKLALIAAKPAEESSVTRPLAQAPARNASAAERTACSSQLLEENNWQFECGSQSLSQCHRCTELLTRQRRFSKESF